MSIIPFSWDQPYPSKRQPVLGRNVVAASQPLAAQAGLHMMFLGGNAVDAALATAIALTVVEPTGNGLGGDAFAILFDGEGLHGLNGSGRAPLGWSRERFKSTDRMPRTGWDAGSLSQGSRLCWTGSSSPAAMPAGWEDSLTWDSFLAMPAAASWPLMHQPPS